MEKILFSLSKKIKMNAFIDDEKKSMLINYLDKYINKKVKIVNFNHTLYLEQLLPLFDYDSHKLNGFLNMAFNICNGINERYSNPKYLPSMTYVADLYKFLKQLKYDINAYDPKHMLTNLVLCRIHNRVYHSIDKLNDEVSIVELTNLIINELPEDTKNLNFHIVAMLKSLDMIDQGLKDLDNLPKKIFLSNELIELLTNGPKIYNLALIDIVKKYYPIYENELFSLINRASNLIDKDQFNTVTLSEFLSQHNAIRDDFVLRKKQVVENINNVTEQVKDKLNKLIDSLNTINTSSSNKNKIQQQIEKIMSSNGTDNSYIIEKIDLYYENAKYYIDNILTDSHYKKEGVDTLLVELIDNTKNYFLDYDGKKFKEIIDYIVTIKGVKVNELTKVKDQCLQLLKQGTVKKLKDIKFILDDFNKFVANVAKKENKIFEYKIFEHTLKNNPALLLNKDINNVIKFIKGEYPINNLNYKGLNFTVDTNIYTYEFLKNIIIDEPEIIFNANIDKINDNLNIIIETLSNLNIKFENFKINEDFLYVLLKGNLKESDYIFTKLTAIFDSKQIEELIQENPKILLIEQEHINKIIQKVSLNYSSEYPISQLLISELANYDSNDFDNYENKPITILTTKPNDNLSLLDLLSKNIISDSFVDTLWDLTSTRELKMEKLLNKLSTLNTGDYKDKDYIKIIKEIVNDYNEIYRQLPDNNIAQQIESAIDEKNKELEAITEELELKLKLENEKIITQETINKSRNLLTEGLNNFKDDIIIEDMKKEIENFVTLINDKYKGLSDHEINKIKSKIKKINTKINTNKELEEALTSLKLNNINVILEEFKQTKYYQIQGRVEETIQSVLNGNNVLIFDSNVDLKSIPSDRHYIEKIYKFLGEGNMSIISNEFTTNNMNNANLLERYSNYRARMCARRANGTPVRVYFIPVINKYFTCYYITGVNIKDHSHIYAGLEDDSVYASKVKYVYNLEETINEFSEQEAIEFIKEKKKLYDIEILPIKEKYHSLMQKKSTKK